MADCIYLITITAQYMLNLNVLHFKANFDDNCVSLDLRMVSQHLIFHRELLCMYDGLFLRRLPWIVSSSIFERQ